MLTLLQVEASWLSAAASGAAIVAWRVADVQRTTAGVARDASSRARFRSAADDWRRAEADAPTRGKRMR